MQDIINVYVVFNRVDGTMCVTFEPPAEAWDASDETRAVIEARAALYLECNPMVALGPESRIYGPGVATTSGLRAVLLAAIDDAVESGKLRIHPLHTKLEELQSRYWTMQERAYKLAARASRWKELARGYRTAWLIQNQSTRDRAGGGECLWCNGHRARVVAGVSYCDECDETGYRARARRNGYTVPRPRLRSVELRRNRP